MTSKVKKVANQYLEPDLADSLESDEEVNNNSKKQKPEPLLENSFKAGKSSSEEEVNPFSNDGQDSDEKELSLPEMEDSQNESNGQLENFDGKSRDSEGSDLEIKPSFFVKLSDNDELEEDLDGDKSRGSPVLNVKKDSPRFAQSNGSLVYKHAKKLSVNAEQLNSNKKKKETAKPSLLDKLTQEYSPVKKEPRSLNPYEISNMGLSPELRKSLLKQNGYNIEGFPEKSKDMLKSEKKAQMRAEREAQVKEFEADAKMKARERALEEERITQGNDPKGKNEEKNKQKPPKKKLIFNTFNTSYPVIDLAAKNCGFRTVFKDHNLVPSAELKAAHRIAPGIYSAITIEEFDVVWFDLVVQPEVLQKIKPYQRLSQWPGIQILSHKNKLAKNLSMMRKEQQSEYDFFPETFLLPGDLHLFKKQLRKYPEGKGPTFILKPTHDCQGRGIYLAREFDDIKNPESQQIAQTYIDNPFLIDGLKFDLRLYVLLYGIHPLRIYLFDDGLARFATNPYQSAKDGDINDLFMHLTNYAINKLSSAYVQNEGGKEKNKSHKRSLKDIYTLLESMGKDVEKLQKDVEDLIIKTIITGQHSLHHIYRSAQPDDLENQTCFQILGFDVMFDSNLKPWLIEINQSPSFATDSKFDFDIKKKLMEDTFKLLDLSSDRKSAYLEAKERNYFERMMSGSKHIKPSYEQKEYQRWQLDKKRDSDELPILMRSGYKCIFPIKNSENQMRKYNGLLKLSRELQDSFTHGRRIKPSIEDNVYDIILKAQCKGQAPTLMPQQARPKTAAARSKTIAGKKSRAAIEEVKSPFLKEESKMKDKILQAQMVQNVKRKVLEQEKKRDFQAQLKEFATDQNKDWRQSKLMDTRESNYYMQNERQRDLSKTPTRTKTIEKDRTSMIVKIPEEKLTNPYTKNIHIKKPDAFKNQYVGSEKPVSNELSNRPSENLVSPKGNQKKVQKPTLTPLAQLRERAQQNKVKPSGKEYNPVLSGRRGRSKTPFGRDYKGKLEAHSDSDPESEYSGSPEKYSPASIPVAKKEKPEPHSFVTNFLSEKGIITDETPLRKQEEQKSAVQNRYVPLHKRKQQTPSQVKSPKPVQSSAPQFKEKPKHLAFNNYFNESRENQQYNKQLAREQSSENNESQESDVASEISTGLEQKERQQKEVINKQIEQMISKKSTDYEDESMLVTTSLANQKEKNTNTSKLHKKQMSESSSSKKGTATSYQEKLNKLKANNRKLQTEQITIEQSDNQSQRSSSQSQSSTDNYQQKQTGIIQASPKKKKPVRSKAKKDHNATPQVVDIEIIPTPKTLSPAKKRSPNNFRKSIDDREISQNKGPIEYYQPDDKKMKSVLKMSDTVSKLKTADSMFRMDTSSQANTMLKPSDFMSQSVQQLPQKKKVKPPGPPLYERKDSLVNQQMSFANKQREQRNLNDLLYAENLRQIIASPLKKSVSDLKPKAPKKEKLDPSKDMHLKNLEKLAQLQKEKEKEKREELKKKAEVTDPLSPTKEEKKKVKDERQKKENQMIASKLKFLKLIEDLKSKGKDPVFNLTKDFTVNAQIGLGTFAVVKRCTHNKSKYEIALKTYDKKLLTRKSQLMAIHREIYILAGLDHPNIMKLFEVIDTKSHVNLVQEYCHGHNLYDYIKKFGQKGKIGKNTFYSSFLSEGRAKNIFRQIISAISYMHGLGLVHRDLRIENILINDQNYEIKFIDFGFATSFQQNDKLQMIGGVPQYKNPDVAKNKTVNGQIADTYALAIILYIMLTGGVPQWANYDSDLYQQVTADKMMLPTTENIYTGQKQQIFSAEAQDLIQKMFQAETKNRMKTQDIVKHPWLGLSGADASGFSKSIQNQSTHSSSETKHS